MKINSDAQVANLNADKLDNLDSSTFFRSTYVDVKVTASNGTQGALDPISCDAGDFALGGGYSAVDKGTHIIKNQPSPNGDAWAVSWFDDSTPDTIEVFVVCADVGTPHQ